jgi:hypothetical protein
MVTFNLNTREGTPVRVNMGDEEVKLSSNGEIDKTLKFSQKHMSVLSGFLEALVTSKKKMSKTNLMWEIEEFTQMLESGWFDKK